MEDRNVVKKLAQLSNMNIMVIFVLMAFLALSIGLAFFFLVDGRVGYGVGVTMFVVSALTFAIGEINYFSKMKRIEMWQ